MHLTPDKAKQLLCPYTTRKCEADGCMMWAWDDRLYDPKPQQAQQPQQANPQRKPNENFMKNGSCVLAKI